MSINLNDFVRIELTEYGYEMYKAFCESNSYLLKPYTNGIFHFMLYEIITIFGEEMYLHNYEKFFKNNEIVIEL